MSTFNKVDMAFALCRFVSKARKEKGGYFPLKTLRHLVISIQMYIESIGFNWKLIDGDEYVSVKLCLDNVMKENASMGLGRVVKLAQAFEFSAIEKMWNSGVLGEDSPQQLSDTVLFLLGLNCALRAGKELLKY